MTNRHQLAMNAISLEANPANTAYTALWQYLVAERGQATFFLPFALATSISVCMATNSVVSLCVGMK